MKVVVICLQSYAPLHLGQERWKRVTKAGWPFIPGSTLYGAIAQALIKVTCRKENELTDMEMCKACLDEAVSPCGYAQLLKEVKKEDKMKIRFSPLVVSLQENSRPYDAEAFGKDAARDYRPLMGILPRAPINRESHAIHRDQLHGVMAHQPFQRYRGFVYTDEEFIPTLKIALRTLPFFPFGGGRGKFSQVEAFIEHIWDSPKKFLPKKPWLNLALLTPAIISPNDIKEKLIQSISGFRLRRYRFWRTGLYYEADDWSKYGFAENRAHPTMTNAKLGLPEGTVIRLKNGKEEQANKFFLRGFGDRDFTYLGWGQIFFKE